MYYGHNPKFPDNFMWGASSAAWQVEGGVADGGRTPAIIDLNSKTKKPFADNTYAADHYHHYKEDVALMAECGFSSYRFSLSWSRIIPHADGKVNPEGIAFYNDLINELVAHNITPIVTLYHYDLPVWVDELGGWKSRDTVERFEHYCRVCFENFGDRVKYWLSLNEQNMQICYKAMAAGIIKQAGGADNIVSATHCMTRLRLVLRDRSKFDTDAVKQVPGVLNVIIQNGEYQVVIGQDVPDLYEEVVKIDGIQAGGSVQDDEAAAKDLAQDHGNIGNAILSFIGGTFGPVIPVLVAGGLTGAVLSLLTNVFGVSAESGTYTIFYAINQATFYFLPIFIGFAAAARLKSNGFLGAFLGAILLYSSINGAEGLDFFGIPVQAISYNSTVFPVILGVLFMSVVYKFLQKHLPVFLKTIVVPLLTMLITVPVTLIVLGPVGNTVGTWLANGVYALYQAVPALAVMVIGITTPLMVFFGMNNATYPVVFALMAAVNSDPLICTGMAPANVAVGGACLAASLLSKNVEEKSVSVSAGITALCGITEPGVYGVLFPKTYPLIGAMIGGGIGGLLAGILGMTQYVISTPGFISLPAYIDPTGSSYNLIVSVIVMIVAVVLGFVATYALGKRAEAKK